MKKQELEIKKKVLKELEHKAERVNFATRCEFEEEKASDDYVSGYIKGVVSAITDLGLSDDTRHTVAANLKQYREWMLSDEEDFEEWLHKKIKEIEDEKGIKEYYRALQQCIDEDEKEKIQQKK